MSSFFPERAINLSAMWATAAERDVTKPFIEEPQTVTDEEALIRLKAHDKDALTLLFARYSRLVLTIGYRVLRDFAEAEDVMQDVFIYLFENPELFDAEKGSAKTWITQKAYSRSLDRRDFLAYRQIYLGTDADTQPDSLVGDFDLERVMGSKLLRDKLHLALAELPEKQRLTLVLNFFEGLNMREISERIGDPITHVRHHYYRGLEKLRKSAVVRSLQGKTL